MEVWKTITNFPRYSVSSHGRIKNSETGRILKINPNSRGYYQVGFTLHNKYHPKTVHRLVALAFIPNPGNKPQVNHKDGIKKHNESDNLEWVTNSENQIHAYDNGLSSNLGETHPKAVFTEHDVLVIRYDYIHSKNSHRKLGKKYGVSASAIRDIVNRKTWKHIK